MFKRHFALPFLTAVLGAGLTPVHAGPITLPTLPTMGPGVAVYLNYYSSNTVDAGGSASAAQLAPGSAVTGITIWGAAHATMGSDATFAAGDGNYYGRAIFDFDFSNPLLAGTSSPSDVSVPLSWDFTISVHDAGGNPIGAISDYEMEPENLFTEGWGDNIHDYSGNAASSVHATGSMLSTIPGGWTYAGRSVVQLYVSWIAPAGSTLNIDVPQGSSIDLASVDAAAPSATPEPGTFLLGFPFLAVAAGVKYRHAWRFRHGNR